MWRGDLPVGPLPPRRGRPGRGDAGADVSGRLWLAVGSGEALNESITGQPWPDKAARNQRLREAVQVMRELWKGERVDHDGAFRVRHARLYTRPERPPAILLAALSAETAGWGAQWPTD